MKLNNLSKALLKNTNVDLPPLNPILARSSYAMALTLLVTYCSANGIDLFAYTAALGLGDNQAEVLDNQETVVSGAQIVLNMALPAWYWLERRAPNFRLSFSRS